MTVRAIHKFAEMEEILGIGAGNEPTSFYLTNYARRVFATDLYANPGVWTDLSKNNMLISPGANVVPPLQWNPQRLIVQHMNALELRYPDESFDAIFSCGSIEHFGELEDITCAAREMGRVLKVGGLLTLATEFRISGPKDKHGIPGALIFSPEMLCEHIIRPSGLIPVDSIDFHVSRETAELAYPLEEAVLSGIRNPSVALAQDGLTWTSIFLALRKF
jgi:SAM-dependent methyltransferase